LETNANRSFSNGQLIPLLKLANTKNYEAVKTMVKTLPKDATAEDMTALLEDIDIKLNEKAAFIREKEELKQAELQRLKEKETQETKENEKEKARIKEEEEVK
jgi:hypothetical protein